MQEEDDKKTPPPSDAENPPSDIGSDSGEGVSEGSSLEDVPFEKGELEKPPAKPADGDAVELAPAVFEVPVKVTAVLGNTRMEVKDLVNLKRGEVVQLDRRVGEMIDVLVNDRPIAKGEVVLVDGVLGVTLVELVKEGVS